MPQERRSLGKDELFQLLAQGHAARVTVLTPNRRLAQSLQRDFDRAQLGRGSAVWETADILPFGPFVERLWEDALYSDLAPSVPLLLAPAQEQALWEESVLITRLAEPLLSAAAAAAQCREAWRLAKAWRLDPRSAGAPSEDARAFLEWASAYERATREKGYTDGARLPDVIAPMLAHAALRKPALVALFGFDLVTPQVRDFLAALAAQGTEIADAVPPARRATVARLEFTEAKEEIAAAARWARARLEGSSPSALGDEACPGNPLAGGRGEGQSPRIGIVVPDLVRSRAQVQRLFANAMQPDHLLAHEARGLPFDLSLGTALADFPLVGDALQLIALTGREMPFEPASRLIRSPFIAAAEAELDVRARLDARLRKRCGPSVSLDALVRHCASPKAPRAGLLLDRLERLATFRKASLFDLKTASEWAKAFLEALRIAGFPGDRALDSVEHQTLDKWHEVLGEFAALERVTGRMGHSEARRRLGQMARDIIFQPEGGDVPIQIVGVLESAGLEFDHLWVMGLTDEAWPLAARPNPFIAVSVQRRAGIPQADPVSSLELDRRITQGWLRSADEVVLSHSRMKGESEQAPSSLIASTPLAARDEREAGRPATLREAIRGAAAIETLQDGVAPVVDVTLRLGGTGLFKDQAACPFRAFAVRRLRSEPLEMPRLGLDAGDRGTLVHGMLAAVWRKLGSRGGLAAASPEQLEEVLEAGADEAIASVRRYRAEALSGRYAQLERARLVRLGGEWLAVERQREDFAVIAIEEKHPVTFGGIVAVAFAQVKTGESRFRGISRMADVMPDVCTIDRDRGKAAKRYRDWGELVAGWRVELDATGRGFASGDARVDPKRGATTCENCKQHVFCRIAEKTPLGAAGEGGIDIDE